MRFPKLSYDKLIKRGIAITLSVATLALVFGKSFQSRALFDESKAITYQTFSSRTTVEDSVLFIGTYIIHKDAMTDDLYEKAQDSASESGQNEMYYKSELSDGQWFLLDTIDNGVKGISTNGLPESIDTINPLYVTYYVGSDGVLRDAKTMAGLNPFDIPDPYDLASLPELDPIRTQYTMSEGATSISQNDFLKNRNSTDSGNIRSDVYYYQLLSTFFSLNLRDAQTDRCDTQLANLNQSYIALKDAGEDEEAAIVYDLMSRVDATRRLLIMERLSEMDDNLLSKLNELSTGTYYTPYGNFKDSSEDSNKSNLPDYTVELEDSAKHDFTSSTTTNPFVLQMFQQLGILSNSSGWWTVLEKYEADKARRAEEANSENDDYVRDEADSEYPFTQDAAIIEAIGTAMENCSNSYNTYRAKALVDSDDLLQHFIYDYSTQVIEQTVGTTVGGPIEYLKHVTNIKEGKISDQGGELTYLLNTLIPMASSRYTASSSAQPGEAYQAASSEGAKKSALEDQKADQEADRAMLQYLIEAMRQRQAAETALEFVNERISITEGLLSALPDGEYRTYSASSVQAHIVWLKEEAQKIIDSDESLRSKLADLLARKNALQDKRDACLDNNDLAGAKKYDALIAAVDQDIARETANGGGSSQDSLTDKLVDKALSKLADNANADLSGIADALAELGEDDKLDALAEKAEASGAGADTLAGIKDAKNKNGGSGADSDALLAQLEALFGKSLDEMDEDELAVAGATCSRLSRSGITPADSLTQIIVGKLVDKNNKFTYSQYTDNVSTEYISMETLSNCTDFRYFYDDSKAIATMTKGSIVYIFKRGSDEMYKQDTSSDGEPLTEKVAYQGVVFLDEDDTQNYFNCEAEYCNKTKYAICLTAPKQAAVKDYTERLEEFFKEN